MAELKLQKSCCVCLTEGDNLIPLLLLGSSSSSLFYNIIESSEMKPEAEERISRNICFSCNCDLAVVTSFKAKCEESDQKLKEYEMLSLVKTELPESFEDEENVLSANEYFSDNESIKREAPDTLDLDFKPNESSLRKYKKSKRKIKSAKKKKNIKSESVVKREKKESGVRYSCSECGLDQLNKARLIVHLRTHTGEKPFQCDYCSKKFSLKASLKAHIEAHDGRKNFICNICGKQFSYKSGLGAHAVIHTGEKRFKCHLCGAEFTQKLSLTSHVMIHENKRLFLCAHCPKRFNNVKSLKEHVRSVHDKIIQSECDICKKQFRSKCAYKNHMRIHRQERAHQCAVCGKTFIQKVNLQYHIRKLHSEKSGECDVCNKSFSNLTAHKETHLRKRNLQCKLCPKKFTWERTLIAHLEMHNVNPNMPCYVSGCSKMYNNAKSIKLHIRVKHMDSPDLQCHYCKGSFSGISALIKHVLTSHSSKPDPCKMEMA